MREENINPVGESIRYIQEIINKYIRTPEELEKAEIKLREALKKERYYRFQEIILQLINKIIELKWIIIVEILYNIYRRKDRYI